MLLWTSRARCSGAAQILDHDKCTYAAALAYRGLLALFPLVIFVIALISVLHVDRLLDGLGDLARSGPPGQVPLPVNDWLIGQLRGRPGGAVLSVGALTAIWATATGIRMLRRALHTAYGVPETRPVWKRIVFSVLVVPVFARAGIVAIGLLVVTSRTLMRGAGLMALDAAIVAVWDWFRVPAALMLLMGLLSAVYKVAAGDHSPLRRSLPGAALAAALWALVSVAFAFAPLHRLALRCDVWQLQRGHCPARVFVPPGSRGAIGRGGERDDRFATCQRHARSSVRTPGCEARSPRKPPRSPLMRTPCVPNRTAAPVPIAR